MAKQVRTRRNQFGEIVEGDDKYLTLENWQTVWDQGKTKFHKECVHPMLVKHLRRITDGREAPLSMFLPLCGKSRDLKWLAEQGHQVIGNEISEIACEQFFQENNMNFETLEITGIEGKCFKSKDSQYDVTLFCCDFFCLTSEIVGSLHGIWDRGSFAAINPSDRKRYGETMNSLLSKDTRYLLDVFTIDHSVFAGPPFTTTEDELKHLYGDCSIERLEHKDVISEWQKDWGLKEFYETDYLIMKDTGVTP